VKRREFIALLGGAAMWPVPARAQQVAKLPTIGFLGGATPSLWSAWVSAFLQRLRELGWVEGRNVAIEYRWAEGRNERYTEIATEFVRLKVDLIVTAGASVVAAKQATSVIPIVFAVAADPLGTGLVASLARPGGNTTGLSNQAADLAAKRLELLREVVPGLRRLAIMANVEYPAVVLEMREVETAAGTLGLDENDADRARTYAQELIALAPDIFLAEGTFSVTALQHFTRTLPIVFASVGDPVGAGFVDSLSRPGGNATGFMTFEYGFSGKWLELLKQIAPQVTRAAVIRDPAFVVAIAQFGAIQAVAPVLGVEVTPVSVGDIGVIEHAVEAFARRANGGLIMAGGASSAVTRDLIITLAARHKLPAVYGYRFMVTAGGLVSYGPDNVDQFGRAAGYVDRILKGVKPADLPVQAPTKYELVVNLKTAKAIGLDVPASVLARADAVIE